MNDSVLVTVLTNSTVLFFVLALLGIILHLALVRWLHLSKRTWKRMEYLILLIAAVALSSLAGDVRRMIASTVSEIP